MNWSLKIADEHNVGGHNRIPQAELHTFWLLAVSVILQLIKLFAYSM